MISMKLSNSQYLKNKRILAVGKQLNCLEFIYLYSKHITSYVKNFSHMNVKIVQIKRVNRIHNSILTPPIIEVMIRLV